MGGIIRKALAGAGVLGLCALFCAAAPLGVQAQTQTQTLAQTEGEAQSQAQTQPQAQEGLSLPSAVADAQAALSLGRAAEARDAYDRALNLPVSERPTTQELALRAKAFFGRALALTALDRAEGRLSARTSRALASLPPADSPEDGPEIDLARAAVYLSIGPLAFDQAQIALDSAAARGLREDAWRLEMMRGELAYRMAGYETALNHFKAAGSAGAPQGVAELAVADSLMAMRRWAEAEAAYKRVLEIRPADAEALVRRVRAHEAQRRPPSPDFDALAAMEQAGAQGASGYAFHAERGALRRAASLLEPALEDLREAAELAPQEKKAMARYAYGAALVDARRWQEASDVFRSVENQPEMRALLAFQRGRMLLERGDPGQALNFFEAALSLRPGDPSALFNRGVAHLRLGRRAEAEQDFAAAAARDPMAPDLRDALGRLKYRTDPAQAKAFYDAAVSAHPQDPESWTQRAGLRLAMGEPALAVRDAAEALKLSARHPQATLYMAEALLALGDAPAALDYADRLREAPAQAGLAALVRAQARLDQGEANAAMRDLDFAEETGAPPDRVALTRGEAAMRLGLSDTEIGGYYDQAVALSGGSAAALEGRARFYVSRGMAGGALADLTRALGAAPRDPTLLARRGELLRLTGDCAKALADLDLAFELGFSDSGARRARASCRAKDGRFIAAIGDFFRAMF